MPIPFRNKWLWTHADSRLAIIIAAITISCASRLAKTPVTVRAYRNPSATAIQRRELSAGNHVAIVAKRRPSRMQSQRAPFITMVPQTIHMFSGSSHCLDAFSLRSLVVVCYSRVMQPITRVSKLQRPSFELRRLDTQPLPDACRRASH